MRLRFAPAAVAFLALVLLIGAAWGCRTAVEVAPERPPIRALEPDGRSSASAYFRAPFLSHLALSPDGLRLAAVASRGARDTLVLISTEDLSQRALNEIERSGPRKASWMIHRLGWGSDEDIVVSVGMASPVASVVRARQTRLFVFDLAGEPRYLGEDWPLQAWSQFQDDIASFLPDDPHHIVLNWWQPDQGGVGARRVNLNNGSMRTIVSPRHGSLGWAADVHGNVRAGWGRSRDGLVHFLEARADPDGSFEEVARFRPYDEEGWFFAGFGERAGTLYLWSERGGTRALYEYDLEKRALVGTVFEHPGHDATHLVQHPRDGRLLAVGYADDRPRLHFVDAGFEAEHRLLAESLPGEALRYVTSDRSGRLWILESSGDRQPPQLHLFDRETRSLRFLFDAHPELVGVELAPMQRVEFEARDGMRIPGQLTVPVGAEPRGLPVVVMPHGGPATRDVWGWDPRVQFLASRGFAVFQLDFRGSSGYGRAHRVAGYGEWGGAMQDDVTDGVRWLIGTGVADPDRIGIFGASYGGYAALMALVKTPELFRAGASWAAVTDLPTLLDDDSQYYAFEGPMREWVGRRWSDRAYLASLSPARLADRFHVPVLVGHGSQDWRVHMKQATRLLDALEDAGVEAEGLLYSGEDHSFHDERNRIDFYTRLGDFFERHLLEGEAPAS